MAVNTFQNGQWNLPTGEFEKLFPSIGLDIALYQNSFFSGYDSWLGSTASSFVSTTAGSPLSQSNLNSFK